MKSRIALLFFAAACSRPVREPVEPVDPVTLTDAVGDPDAATGAEPDASDAKDVKDVADAKPSPGPTVAGGLWVVDALGAPVGVLIQRGHQALSTGGGVDLLRDGAVVYSPSAGVFFGVQMSTGAVVHPRLGVTDGTCATPAVAGYYTDSDAVSGQGYAFVWNGKWYRVKEFLPLELVPCGGTVADGAPGKCAPHGGSCRGFPVQAFSPPLPLKFAGPLSFAWKS